MAGQNNFLQWNPTQANQETDSQYAADPQRVGGAIDGQPFPAVSANKALYQATTGVAALMQMMAAKGFNVVDTNIATLASVLAAIQTTADSRTPYQNVPYSSTVTLNLAEYSGFQIAVSGNMTVNFVGQVPGQNFWMLFLNDGTGGHTITCSALVGEAWYDPTANGASGLWVQVVADGSMRALGPAMSGSGINATPVGQSSPAAGSFTSLASSALANLYQLGVITNAMVNGNFGFGGYSAGPIFIANRGTSGSDGFVFNTDQSTGMTSPTNGTGQLQSGGTAAVQWNSNTFAVLVALTVAGAFTAQAGGTLNGSFGGNPSLTGTPLTTTPAANDNTTRIANTSWVQALVNAATAALETYANTAATNAGSTAQTNSETYTANSIAGYAGSLGNAGYIKLPAFMGAFILQWGTTGNLGGGNTPVTFSINFPNQVFGAQATALSTGNADFMYITALSNSGLTVHDDGGGAEAMWFAYGH